MLIYFFLVFPLHLIASRCARYFYSASDPPENGIWTNNKLLRRKQGLFKSKNPNHEARGRYTEAIIYYRRALHKSFQFRIVTVVEFSLPFKKAQNPHEAIIKTAETF